MEKEPLVSIIVAVYKAENFLDTCVKQLCNQTYQNIELLLIDDGSPDKSGVIADAWAKKDSRIKVFHKVNGGPSSALNVGIEHATGEYIANVDGDDLVHPDMIRRQVEIMQSSHAGIVITGHREINERRIPDDQYVEERVEVFKSKEIIRKLIEDVEINSYFWGKLYRAEYIKRIRFPEEYTYEDTAMLAEIILSAEYIAYNRSVNYFYYQNPNSILHMRDLNLNLQQLRAYQKQMKDIVAVYPEFGMALQQRHFRLELSTYCYYLKQYLRDTNYTEAMRNLWIDLCARRKRMKKDKIKITVDENLRYLRCAIKRALYHAA